MNTINQGKFSKEDQIFNNLQGISYHLTKIEEITTLINNEKTTAQQRTEIPKKINYHISQINGTIDLLETNISQLKY